MNSQIRRGLALGLPVLAMLFAGLMAQSASAAKVANPGPVTFTFEEGTLQIRDDVFEASSADDPATATGTIQANGSVNITSFNFPDLPPIDGPLGDINVSINVLSASGNVNPLTGAGNIQASIRIDIDGTGVGSNCRVSPINVNLTTGAAGGSPYNTSNGRMTGADHTFSVPGASGCSTFPINVNNEINSQLGLPSPSGQNHAVLTARSTPVLQRAIQPAFTATPSSGPAPLAVSFDASSTFHTRPVSSYAWDLDGNGSFETTTPGPTTQANYATPGTRTVGLRVTDADGDSSTTTRQVVVGAPIPDLSIAKSHDGDFVTGAVGTYLIDVTNNGSADSSGAITVTDTLPDGMTLNAARGDGWTCGASGQVVTCENPGPVAANGGALDQLELDVDVASAAVGIPANTASVSTPGDTNASNDSASDPTNVFQGGIDLRMTKTIDPDDGLFRRRRATYVLSVENAGTTATAERIRVVDQLPEGVEFVSVSGGLAWVCSEAAGEVRCFSDEVAAPGQTLQPINVRVDVEPDAPDSIANSATVTTAGDALDGNDTGTHVGTVEGYATDYSLTKAHTGDFVVGEPGSYRLTVRNVGSATGDNDVAVYDQLPAGMALAGHSGGGWTCQAAGQDVNCTHAGNVEPDDALPVLTLQVDTGDVVAGEVTNTAVVSSDDDFNVENDVGADPTQVRAPQPDLAVAKSHAGNFIGGGDGSYAIEVTNVSGERADGPTTVVDTLPAGMSYAGAAGSGWDCAAAGQQVSCEHAGSIAAGASSTLQVDVAVAGSSAGQVLTNVAEVTNAADTDPANNRAEDPTMVEVPAAAPTRLQAQGIVFSWRRGQDPKLLPYVSATLTSNGQPVVGRTVGFTQHVLGQHRVICRAETGADGVASCQPGIEAALQAALSGGRYSAVFHGDAQYGPAFNQGAFVNLLNLRLL